MSYFFHANFKKSQYFHRGLKVVPPQKISIILVPKSSQCIFRKRQPIWMYTELGGIQEFQRGWWNPTPVGNRAKYEQIILLPNTIYENR